MLSSKKDDRRFVKRLWFILGCVFVLFGGGLYWFLDPFSQSVLPKIQPPFSVTQQNRAIRPLSFRSGSRTIRHSPHKNVKPSKRIRPKYFSTWPKRWSVRPWSSLAKKRNTAVWKGVLWMDQFIKKRWDPKALGVDAIYIFLELAVTSTDGKLRRFAKKRALFLAKKMQRYFLRKGVLKEKSELTDAIDLITESKSIGLNIQRLLSRVKRAFRRLPRTDDILQTSLSHPALLTTDDYFDLLINVYIMEKAALSFPLIFSTSFSLRQLLFSLRKRRYLSYSADTNPKKKVFADDAFLATHVAYVFNYYGRIKLYEKDFPSVFLFVKQNFSAVVKMNDIEILAEFVDVFRSAGRSEQNHLLIRAGTMFLLEKQHEDGSWGKWKALPNPYDAIHFTWCAVLALRERFFLRNTLSEEIACVVA